jgi:hypothetical protein
VTLTKSVARSPGLSSIAITVGNTGDVNGVGTIVAGEIKAEGVK